MPLLLASNDEHDAIADTLLINYAMPLLLDCFCASDSDNSLTSFDASGSTLFADDAALFALLTPPATDIPISIFYVVNDILNLRVGAVPASPKKSEPVFRPLFHQLTSSLTSSPIFQNCELGS